ncbi:MAG: ABC transporter permease [Cyclobacteriaceae bacterium]|nr:ABC transporter permease [Cyclobacteriaceae bacterium]
MTTIVRYILADLLRTRFALAYTVFLAIVTMALFQLDNDPSRVTLSILNIVLMVVPLFSIVFATIHYYNSYEFMTLLLSQPVKRSTLLLSEWASVAGTMAGSLVAGVGIPSLIYGALTQVLPLLLAGVAMTCCFVSLAFLASVMTQDKARAIGISLLFWIYFSMIYDGLLLLVVYSFSDYPIEKITLALIALNPIDLVRISILMEMDVSALMGYTGAFYRSFFGGTTGMLFCIVMMMIWILFPLWISRRIFMNKDL